MRHPNNSTWGADGGDQDHSGRDDRSGRSRRGRRGGPHGDGRRGGPHGEGFHGGPFGGGFGGRGDGPRGPRGGAPRGGDPRERRRGGRAQRGDVRAAVLLLLAEEPMHGYQLMQAIAERTNDAWRPSAGAIYPTLAQLEDEGLIGTTADGGRRLATLTEAGQRHLAENASTLGDPFAAFGGADTGGASLRAPLRDLQVAVRQVAVAGDPAQVAAAAAVIAAARRELYLILAGEAGEPGAGTAS